jgi:putative transposase
MGFLYYKFRIKPNKEQEEKLVAHCDAARFIYNQLLAQNISLYEKTKKFHFGLSLAYESKKLRNLHEFLKVVNAQSLQQAALNLGKAFTNRFKNGAGFPKFKSRRNNRQSFTAPQYFGIDKNRIRLPKIGWVDMIQHRKISGKAKSITIIKEIDQWYASILCENEDVVYEIDQNSVVGLDVGIKTFVTTSDGEIFNLPDLKKETAKLKTLQRRHSKKAKGSNNRNKARIKVAKQYRKISRIKTDAINNFVSAITKTYDVISMENLNIKGMKKNKRLSSAIHQLPWFDLKTKLKQKSKGFHEVDRWFPSSKTCSCCGWINKDLKLSDRTFKCDSCDLRIDRDVNAAINWFAAGWIASFILFKLILV